MLLTGILSKILNFTCYLSGGSIYCKFNQGKSNSGAASVSYRGGSTLRTSIGPDRISIKETALSGSLYFTNEKMM